RLKLRHVRQIVMPWMPFVAGRARATAFQQDRAIRNAADLYQTKAVALAQREEGWSGAFGVKVALHYERAPSRKLHLQQVKEQGTSCRAELARPFAIFPAERVEERLFDAVFVEKWHVQPRGERSP